MHIAASLKRSADAVSRCRCDGVWGLCGTYSVREEVRLRDDLAFTIMVFFQKYSDKMKDKEEITCCIAAGSSNGSYSSSRAMIVGKPVHQYI